MSRFVSSNASDNANENNDRWIAAQAAIEATKRPSAHEPQQDSLYDVLQKNKAAKEDAIKEELALKHHISTNMGERDLSYLHELEDKERAVRMAKIKEDQRVTDMFRKAQQEQEKAARAMQEEAPATTSPTPQLAKRKREKKDYLLPGLKRKKSEVEEEVKNVEGNSVDSRQESETNKESEDKNKSKNDKNNSSAEPVPNTASVTAPTPALTPAIKTPATTAMITAAPRQPSPAINPAKPPPPVLVSYYSDSE